MKEASRKLEQSEISQSPHPTLLRCLSLDLEVSLNEDTLLKAVACRPDAGVSLYMSDRHNASDLEQFDRLADIVSSTQFGRADETE